MCCSSAFFFIGEQRKGSHVLDYHKIPSERAAMCLITTKFPAIPLPQANHANVLGHSRLHNIDAQCIAVTQLGFSHKIDVSKERERRERERERERETERQMTALLIFQTSELQPTHKENAYTTVQSN